MVGRNVGVAPLLACAALVVSGCTGDGGVDAGDEAATTATTFDPRVDDEASDDRIWSTGDAVLELDGERWRFDLDFCATQPVDPDPATSTVTLQVDGVGADDTAATLQVVETATLEPSRRIQVVSVSFEEPDGRLRRTWEAQRVVDTETGAVEDLHGDGTTPLLTVIVGSDLSVSARAATFWQFDMTGADDERVVGSGDLEVTCA